MRRIPITPEIEALAKRYANVLIKGSRLSSAPLVNLRKLESELSKSSTTIRLSKKRPSPKTGRKKMIFSGDELPEYSKYVGEIIKRYKGLNNLHPREFKTLINDMVTVFPTVETSSVVRIGKSGTPLSLANQIVRAMDYEGVRDVIFKEYMRNPLIGIKTCVYCNAQYALTTVLEPAITRATIKKIKGPGRRPNPRPAKLGATYDLDHNLPKDKYPYLCTNFYNLQPCCPSCNRHKSANKVDFSVYYWDSEDPKPLHFELSPRDIITFRQKNKCEGFKPLLKSSTSDTSLVDAFNKAFSIDSIYSQHSDEIQELLWRHKIYSPSGMAAIKASYDKLFADGFDADRFILGTYADDSDVHKRPLTVLKQDIIKQIKDEEAKGSSIK